MPFWTEEREAGVWESKGKGGDAQVDEEASTW